jgi:cysteinyl-tRNA synthetase
MRGTATSMRIYNTQTRQKETFTPLEPGHARIYACGPTVYNFFHLGNARAFIVFDTLRRYLEYRGLKVTYVQNFTDIDDKMIKRANSENITIGELADRFIAEYFRDADRLNIRRANVHPRATETMPMIIEMVSQLVEKGFAYEAEDGVYFDVGKMPDYGKLSHHNLDELAFDAGDRLSQDVGKRGNLDFALWKKKKEGEPSWPSPWGEGRPGWHIECSAMIKQHLGDTIDIHGGGQDLVFPHHENEIAQSESANGKPFVRYWVHNGFINIDSDKRSKSAGNFFLVRDLTQRYDPLVLRFFMLSSHYRMPINFTTELLDAAQNGFTRIRTCLENLDFLSGKLPAQPEGPAAAAAAKDLALACEQARQAFIEAMDDDMNTADAMAAIFDLVRSTNSAAAMTGIDQASIRAAAAMLRELLNVLGFERPSSEADTSDDAIPATVLALVEARAAAKKGRDFQKADAIRQEILQMGYQVADTAQGPKISKL